MSTANKLKSSSLVEVVIAMTILAIVISITLGVIFKLSDSRYKQQLNAFYTLSELSFETKRDQSYVNLTQESKGFVIQRQIEVFEKDLLKIIYTARINQKLIAEIEEVVRE